MDHHLSTVVPHDTSLQLLGLLIRGPRDMYRLDHFNNFLTFTSGTARSMLRLPSSAFTCLHLMLATSTIVPPPLTRLLRFEDSINKCIYLLVVKAYHPSDSRRLRCWIFIPPNDILEFFAIHNNRKIACNTLVRTPIREKKSALPFLDNLWMRFRP